MSIRTFKHLIKTYTDEGSGKSVYLTHPSMKLSNYQRLICTVLCRHAPRDVAITSTDVTYLGKKRTVSDGPNHLANDGIDFVFISNDGETIIPAPAYGRHLYVLVFIARVLKDPELRPSRIVLELDHIHFHNDSRTSVSLQMHKDKTRRAMSGHNYICHGKGLEILDITPVIHELMKLRI